MRISSILINNYSQTTFLKRYGVEALPTVFLLEALLTFFFASAVGVLMDRHRVIRVFTGLFIFFALTMGLVRAMLPLDFPLIYPILYILKSQAIEVLPILYWDILSDLFTTQQSKRLYTLITAGGILGTTLGSLMTGKVAGWVGADNLLLIFVGGMLVAAFMNELTEKIVGAPIEPRKDHGRKKSEGSFKENVKAFATYSRQSLLLKYMILIIAIPNIVLPIITYQFNVAVDAYYQTEKGTLNFFGTFRGISNAVMFVMLLFSGRLVSRWGVPTSLIFHPINYFISFAALFFRLDIFSAVYSRFSTEFLKTTLNNPARAVLFNFFPERMRGLIRVFLRGNMVRASDFAGSGLLMLIRGLMDPRLLSLVAAPLVAVWIYVSIRLKKMYSSMVFQTLTDKQIDWKALEDVDFQAWVKDRKTMEKLSSGLRDTNPEIALACAEILSKVRAKGWMTSVVEAIPGRPADIQKAMLDLLPPEDARGLVGSLMAVARGSSPEALVHLISALNRLAPGDSLPVMKEMAEHSDARVRVEALVGLYQSGDEGAQDTYRHYIETLLKRGDGDGMKMALEVLGKTGDPHYAKILIREAAWSDPYYRALALSGLAKMRHEGAVEIASKAIHDQDARVRGASLQVLMATEENMDSETLIRFLGDEEHTIREAATAFIRKQGETMTRALIPALAFPSRRIREQILLLLGEMGASSKALSQFILQELKKAYGYVALLRVLKGRDPGKAVSLLIDHLSEKIKDDLHVILRILGIMEFGDRMKVILKAIQSGDRKDMDNAIEVLESSLHFDLRNTLIPLLDESPLEVKLAVGRRHFGIRASDSGHLREGLMGLLRDEDDPFNRALALYALGERVMEMTDVAPVLNCLNSEEGMVREAARWALKRLGQEDHAEAEGSTDPNLIERIICTRKVPLFRGLRVRDLAAIALIASPTLRVKGEVVVREGDPGDSLYLIMDGELGVIKGMGTAQEIYLERILRDDFFGELALVDEMPRSASVRAETEALLLVIESRDFIRTMKENPAIPLNICKILSQRILALQKRLQSQ